MAGRGAVKPQGGDSSSEQMVDPAVKPPARPEAVRAPATGDPRHCGAARPIFQADWWLAAACPEAWGVVTNTQNGRVRGWLPYAVYRRDGFSWCGLPPLTRLAFPLLDLDAGKPETVGRARFHVESDLIRQLPMASVHEFVLPPDHGNALAWQVLGFDARIQHTFRIPPGTSTSTMWEQLNSKTRNLIRRAQEALQPRELDGATFASFYRTNLAGSISPSEAETVARLAEASISHGQGRAIAVFDAGGQSHAAALFVWDSEDYYYFLSTRDVDQAALGAVDLLVWLGMTDAMARGLRFDFDGVSSASRLRFLQSFGGGLANRIVVTRRSLAYEGRLLLRRWRHHFSRRVDRGVFP